jgi:moderate conductance mechanosensitive channel
MDRLTALVNGLLGDERLLANLIGICVVFGGLVVAAFVFHKAFKHGIQRFIAWSEFHWLHCAHERAQRILRAVLLWTTLGLMVTGTIAMGVYHFAGQDIRTDVRGWWARVTGAHILAFGLTLGKLVAIAVLAAIAIRVARWGVVILRAFVQKYLPHPRPEAPSDVGHADHQVNYQATVRRWFFILERFAMTAIVLGAVWFAGRAADWSKVAVVAALLLRILTIVTLARLLTLSCRTISNALVCAGDRHLGQGKFQRYWDRVTRLLPFGERCFEAAVYIMAASMCVRELEFIAFVASYGDKIVKCIGVFFGTRVAIELLFVFINEAFGMYEEDRPVDQKGLTLVPLLQSFCQYAFYFGAGLFMLRIFEVDTTPILAGAGIVGLAGGLGAQSLVTDVVSGFFILFENWYLVGAVVQIGDAVGRVEAVSIRHTQVRDEQGKLFIIPNGQIKTVVNFSKGYVNAVVDVKVPTSANLDRVMQDMTEAGRRLRERRHEVLADTVIKGLVDLTPGDMVVRAVTKVQPGTHLAMQQEYRRLLKMVFDETQVSESRALAA